VARRADDDGWAFKGSQLQLQIYVNRRRGELNEALYAAIPELQGSPIQWRAPLEADGLDEPRDREFLQAVGLDRLWDSLTDFWPRLGPVWDGLAEIDFTDVPSGVVLVEAKSYPAELASACRAKPASRARIEQRLAETRASLGVADHFATVWLERYYQLANRLAHLVWLREQGVQTWLVLIGFTGDTEHVSTTTEAWTAGLRAVGDEMGLDLGQVDGLVDVNLEARPRGDIGPA
jgi:hypothetical protein